MTLKQIVFLVAFLFIYSCTLQECVNTQVKASLSYNCTDTNLRFTIPLWQGVVAESSLLKTKVQKVRITSSSKIFHFRSRFNKQIQVAQNQKNMTRICQLTGICCRADEEGTVSSGKENEVIGGQMREAGSGVKGKSTGIWWTVG